MEKMALTDTHQHLLNVYRDQTLDVSTVRRWVVHFSCGDSGIGSPPLMTDCYECSMQAPVGPGEDA